MNPTCSRISALLGVLLTTASLTFAATPTAQPPLAPRTWITSGPLVHPTADASHPIVAVKDPSVVFHDGRWHIFATTAGSNGWGMACFNFASWDEAPQAKPFYLDQNPNLAGYNCAPQVFYFRPQKKWYMIFQSQQPRFSTTDNIADPMSWSAPQDFFEGTPKSVVEGWLDYWIICDDTHVYLFFPDDHGRMYRSCTTLATPSRVADSSWVKPGVSAWAAWRTGVNSSQPQCTAVLSRGDNRSDREYIDFASQMG